MSRRRTGDRVRSVTVISPHFDDVPLSLGQSLRDGTLSRCQVDVRVAFGRSNWTTFMHPTAGRTTAVSLLRRAEETLASLVFGYRWRAAGWSEALLRTGDMDSSTWLDPDRDLSSESLVEELAEWLSLVIAVRAPRPLDLLLVSAGLGGHLDHRIVARAAASLVGSVDVPIGFYEDRPYVTYLDDAERDRQLDDLGLTLCAVDVSTPVTRSTQMRARRCYTSQMMPYFEEAMDLDREAAATERVWFPVGTVPSWLTAGSWADTADRC